ncbi:protease modulator HflC [Limibaculum sp. FT325]|uniref:protease modulator HflC n=1 Tax=Thermohalobaculum sediminis TaxID=2939436 RepID=UPI0020BDD727|nr:protease modulator HflC [Limibaculum sediminis]MCL5777160.1 protease modulator HflC [Limibaculum sediminis]
MRLIPVIIALLAVTVFAGLSAIYIVDERQQAIVLQFGEVKAVKTEPGIGFKVPLIQEVAFYEARILPLDTSPLEVTPADERRLVVDAFARWRITDVVRFRQAVQTELAAISRLERILNASLREVLGTVSSDQIISAERTTLMQRIAEDARSDARELGVEIIDVRIRRADLPVENLRATYDRMNAERQREAADERARGKEAAQRIRAEADRQAVELTSEANREADIIRGRADAERNRIFADAFGRDQEFFTFYRSMAAYEKSLGGENSTMVITPESEFFDYLKAPQGRPTP